MSGGSNGWPEYQKLVLAELENLNKGLKELSIKVSKMEIQAAIMSTKQKATMTLYGAIGSAIPVVVGLGIWAIKSL